MDFNKEAFLDWKIKGTSLCLNKYVNAKDIRLVHMRDKYYRIESLIEGEWVLTDVIETDSWNKDMELTVLLDKKLVKIDVNKLIQSEED